MKVFLVEDSDLLRARLAALLESVPGVAIVGHADGADEAVRAVLELAPDVVILDLHLRQGHGSYVLHQLRRRATAVDVYVITNFPSEPYREAMLRLGAKGFFDKSTQFDALREVLRARAAG